MRAGVSPDDAELVERVLAGNAGAFDELVRRYLRRAFAVSIRILGNREDAEDMTQESFLAALEKLHTFDTSRPFGPWLFRIVANRSLNARKARAVRRAEPIPDDLAAGGASPLAEVERRERGESLRAALESLPERQRQIVRLFELEGFSSIEIGDMLGMPDGTVRWHLHQARAALRAALKPLKEGEK